MQILLEGLILEHLDTLIAELHLVSHHVSKTHLDNLNLEHQKGPCCKSGKDNPGSQEHRTEPPHSALLGLHALQSSICLVE